MQVIDNFLPDSEFDFVCEMMMSNEFPWYFSSSVASDVDADSQNPDKDFYYVHTFFEHCGTRSTFANIPQALLQRLDLLSLIRCKANSFTKTEQLHTFDLHSDYDFPHKGAIFYLNTCDGGTVFENGDMVESVANRMLLFDSAQLHASTTTTDQKRRVNININYF